MLTKLINHSLYWKSIILKYLNFMVLPIIF